MLPSVPKTESINAALRILLDLRERRYNGVKNMRPASGSSCCMPGPPLSEPYGLQFFRSKESIPANACALERRSTKHQNARSSRYRYDEGACPRRKYGTNRLV